MDLEALNQRRWEQQQQQCKSNGEYTQIIALDAVEGERERFFVAVSLKPFNNCHKHRTANEHTEPFYSFLLRSFVFLICISI